MALQIRAGGPCGSYISLEKLLACTHTLPPENTHTHTHTHPGLGPRHSRPAIRLLLKLMRPPGFFRPAEGQGSAVEPLQAETETAARHKLTQKGQIEGTSMRTCLMVIGIYFQTTGSSDPCSCKTVPVMITEELSSISLTDRDRSQDRNMLQQRRNRLWAGGSRRCSQQGREISHISQFNCGPD